MIWYPYEQLKTMKAPYEIVDANGVYLYTKDQKLIDSVSSWWSVIHGYKHPVINQAIISQVEKFSHVMQKSWHPGCRAIWTIAFFQIPAVWRLRWR